MEGSEEIDWDEFFKNAPDETKWISWDYDWYAPFILGFDHGFSGDWEIIRNLANGVDWLKGEEGIPQEAVKFLLENDRDFAYYYKLGEATSLLGFIRAMSSGIVPRTEPAMVTPNGTVTPSSTTTEIVVPGIVFSDSGDEDEGASHPTNKNGQSYPELKDPRTGENIKFPEGDLQRVPKDQRVDWDSYDRYNYIKEWYDRGYDTPTGGWENYDIHHIQPREFGGDNSFWNLVPVERSLHQQQFNPFWLGY